MTNTRGQNRKAFNKLHDNQSNKNEEKEKEVQSSLYQRRFGRKKFGKNDNNNEEKVVNKKEVFRFKYNNPKGENVTKTTIISTITTTIGTSG